MKIRPATSFFLLLFSNLTQSRHLCTNQQQQVNSILSEKLVLVKIPELNAVTSAD